MKRRKLIDADAFMWKVIEELKKKLGEDELELSILIEDIVESMPDASRMISVEDHLPEEDVANCLVKYKSAITALGHYDLLLWIHGEWFKEAIRKGEWVKDALGKEVVEWMYLPE